MGKNIFAHVVFYLIEITSNDWDFLLNKNLMEDAPECVENIRFI
jgi:hypothetical protein